MTEDPPDGELGRWETGPNDLAEFSLRDVIREGERHASRADDDERAQIAIRVTPPALRPIVGQLAHEQRISYSRFNRYALDLGIEILAAQPPIIAVRRAYDLARSDAMSSGDQDALARLTQFGKYEFQRSQEFRTTFRVSRETAARIADLAMACGIETPRLAVVIVLVAVLTLPNNRGYRDGLIAEVRAFYRHVLYRRRQLSLGKDRDLDDPDAGGLGDD